MSTTPDEPTDLPTLGADEEEATVETPGAENKFTPEQLEVLEEVAAAVHAGELDGEGAVKWVAEVDVDADQLVAYLDQWAAEHGGDANDERRVARGEAGRAADLEKFIKNLPAGVVMCPMCLAIGAIDAEPPFATDRHACALCQGRGEVRTGSLKTGEVTIDCPDCQARGWVLNGPGEPAARPAAAVDFAEGVSTTDYAGRTPDDPDFDWSRVVPAKPATAAEPVTV